MEYPLILIFFKKKKITKIKTKVPMISERRFDFKFLIAGAVANALFAATGKPITKLPFGNTV